MDRYAQGLRLDQCERGATWRLRQGRANHLCRGKHRIWLPSINVCIVCVGGSLDFASPAVGGCFFVCQKGCGFHFCDEEVAGQMLVCPFTGNGGNFSEGSRQICKPRNYFSPALANEIFHLKVY
jgi:hypothetical protein